MDKYSQRLQRLIDLCANLDNPLKGHSPNELECRIIEYVNAEARKKALLEAKESWALMQVNKTQVGYHLIRILELLCDVITTWNDMQEDGDRGRGNEALCLILHEDGSGQLGTWHWDLFHAQFQFDYPRHLSEYVLDWVSTCEIFSDDSSED